MRVNTVYNWFGVHQLEQFIHEEKRSWATFRELCIEFFLFSSSERRSTSKLITCVQPGINFNDDDGLVNYF